MILERLDEAEAELGKALRLGEVIGYPPVQWRSRAALAALHRRSGETSCATEQLERARELIAEIVRRTSEERLSRSLTRIADDLEVVEGTGSGTYLGAGV